MNPSHNSPLHTVLIIVAATMLVCAAACRFARGPEPSPIVPSVRIADTRGIAYVHVRQPVIDSLLTWYTMRKETAFCLGGRIAVDTLVIDRAWPSDPPEKKATMVSTEVRCERYAREGLVGVGHTHPLAFFGDPCEPSSPTDVSLWSVYPTALAQMVMCGDGTAWLGLRDGRYWRARWR